MFTLPPLPYDYDALEPFIDTETMKIHHDKHHQAYVDNLNKALEGHNDLLAMHGTELLANLDKVPEEIKTKVKNNLGGVLNHNFFWQTLCSAEQNAKFKMQNAKLAQEINKTFGSLEKFQEQFSTAALGLFGSGWAWLMPDLKIVTTPNQDTPEDDPILGLDVWEHAYYLKYQNRRAEYIKNWWNVVNWQEVESRYKEATS